MANLSFTRDEVILALDTFYFSNESNLSPDSDAIIQLSELLNTLPIYPKENRPVYFRTPNGIAGQLKEFKKGIQSGVKNPRVGQTFFDVEFEYEDNREELHLLAEAIRSNLPYILTYCLFGDKSENIGFPEGILLGHLHRVVELRDSKSFPERSKCCICQIDLSKIYRCQETGGEYHLMVPPVRIDAEKCYQEKDYICVCPNCHSILHKYRPWIMSERVAEILQ